MPQEPESTELACPACPRKPLAYDSSCTVGEPGPKSSLQSGAAPPALPVSYALAGCLRGQLKLAVVAVAGDPFEHFL